MADFPHYQIWIAMLDGRDRGVLLIVMLVAIALGLLVNTRAFWPALLPKVRAGLLAVYYLSFVVMLVLSMR